jgi:hypothetical protein
VDRQALELPEDHQPEDETQNAHAEPGHQEAAAVHAADVCLGEIRNLEVGLAPGGGVGRARAGQSEGHEHERRKDEPGGAGATNEVPSHAV